jgi:glyoxylase-like metal-dependent hydrolase (beta-lactamase superfamily II)
MEPTYEIYAIRYGHLDRNSPENFIGGDPHNVPMALDYFNWVIKGEDGRVILLDTGFNREMGKKRGRTILRPVDEGLAVLGIKPDTVEDVIISHMHYDHAGNNGMFPQATYHLQDDEIAYCTGRCMCHHILAHAYEPEDVKAMVDRVFDGKVHFHDHVSQVAQGITVHRVGGHTRGLQVTRVNTKRGAVVLGSDASHFYANFQQIRPFPVVDSVSDMIAGYETMNRLASSRRHIVPGHDPLVLEYYPRAHPDVADIVRLDLDPIDY